MPLPLRERPAEAKPTPGEGAVSTADVPSASPGAFLRGSSPRVIPAEAGIQSTSPHRGRGPPHPASLNGWPPSPTRGEGIKMPLHTVGEAGGGEAEAGWGGRMEGPACQVRWARQACPSTTPSPGQPDGWPPSPAEGRGANYASPPAVERPAERSEAG